MRTAWSHEPLKNFILDIKDGGTPSRKVPDYFGGDVRWCVVKDIKPNIHETAETLTELGLSKCSAKLWPEGSVIISLGATIGEIGIARIPVATKQGLAGIVPDTDRITPEFLAYALREKVEVIRGMARGTTIKEVRPRRLAEELEINVPTLEEQKRIVAVLDQAFAALDRARALAEANLADAEELFSNILEERISTLFNEHNFRSLIDFCGERGITYGVIKLGDHMVDGVPCLRTSNVRPLFIDTDGMKNIAPTLSDEYRRTILKGGEVLVNVRGTLGGVAVVPPKMANWNVSREVAMVDITKANPFFIAYFVASKGAQNWLTGVTKGAAYKGINLSDLRELKVPDVGRDIQNKLVSELDDAASASRTLSAGYQSKLNDLDGLRQSLLQKAFAGELT